MRASASADSRSRWACATRCSAAANWAARVVDELLRHQLAREELLGAREVERGTFAERVDTVAVGDGRRERRAPSVGGRPAGLEDTDCRLAGRLGAHRRRCCLGVLAGRQLAAETDAGSGGQKPPLGHEHGRARLLGLRAVVAGIEPDDDLAGPDDLVVAHHDLHHLTWNLAAHGRDRTFDIRVIGTDAEPTSVPCRACPARAEEEDQTKR